MDIEDLSSCNHFGFVHSTDSFTCVDGPGIRFLVFTQGCNLRCVFCSNRDTWDKNEGSYVSCSDVIAKLHSLKSYLAPNGGGITVSGGEPMLQAEFVASIFRKVKRMGLTTCIDTAGAGTKERDWDAVLPYTDRVLFCIKHIIPEKYKEITGRSQRPAMLFAEELRRRGIPYQLRYVYCRGYTDDEEGVKRLFEWSSRQPTLCFIELLPYHELGKSKWELLGKKFQLNDVKPPSVEELRAFVKKGEEYGVEVRCGKV